MLIDESLPVELADELSQFEVKTVHAQGWLRLKNGILLRMAVALPSISMTSRVNNGSALKESPCRVVERCLLTPIAEMIVTRRVPEGRRVLSIGAENGRLSIEFRS